MAHGPVTSIDPEARNHHQTCEWGHQPSTDESRDKQSWLSPAQNANLHYHDKRRACWYEPLLLGSFITQQNYSSFKGNHIWFTFTENRRFMYYIWLRKRSLIYFWRRCIISGPGRKSRFWKKCWKLRKFDSNPSPSLHNMLTKLRGRTIQWTVAWSLQQGQDPL